MSRTVPPGVLAAAAVGLFLVWSNSFIAIGYLLGAEGASAQFDYVGLTVARFLPAALVCGVYVFGFQASQSWRILRAHWRRLLACAFLMVPSYNFALYYGQQHGVPAPVASLSTALVPLFVLILATFFLGERVTRNHIVGFAVAVVGMTLIGFARHDGKTTYPVMVAITSLAPLSWSLYSVLSKPLAGTVSPLLWSYLSITIGGALVLPLLPGPVWNQWRALDLPGWGALLYLTFPCSILGFVVWTWLLRHLPASSVGFTVFLNPPLTTISKWMLAGLVPATFVFTIRSQEWWGGALALVGLWIAVMPRSRRNSNKKRGRDSSKDKGSASRLG